MTSAGRVGDSGVSASAERVLSHAEQRVRLLDRLTPRNLAEERGRLLRQLEAGQRAEPHFQYEPPSGFAELRAELEQLIEALQGGGTLAELYADRAEELLLEVRIVEAVGTEELPRLAMLRYPSHPSAALEELLAEFRALAPEVPSELVRASDETDPRSLISVLRAHIGELRAPVRIELRAQLHSVAAAGDGFVAIRGDAALSVQAAERIARHELFAHVLPRLAARSEALGIYRVGVRGANEDEEGRALCIEERSSLWNTDRKRELLRRHELALAVRAGAELNELVEKVVADADGVTHSVALDLALRALRGGGLAREAVYLPAYLRVSRAFAADPASERYFERGRASLASLSKLRELDVSR